MAEMRKVGKGQDGEGPACHTEERCIYPEAMGRCRQPSHTCILGKSLHEDVERSWNDGVLFKQVRTPSMLSASFTIELHSRKLPEHHSSSSTARRLVE